MAKTAEISICIPAYKNIHFLDRLLNSIALQTFEDYEVIITDDSPDSSVHDFIKDYKGIKEIKYYRNQPALGTPENWNEGIRRATGKWVKMMHDDDWFTTPDALQTFHNTTVNNPACSFFYAAFKNVTEESGKKEVVRCDLIDKLIFRLSPLHLFKKVYVGNPSCTLIKRDIDLFYDKDFKYVVDFEYYIRCIKKLRKSYYIDEVLLNIGFNNQQVTKYTFRVAEVQIPENLILLKKMGAGILRNIIVYDYYWRMFRNLQIRRLEDVSKFYVGTVHPILKHIIKFQQIIPYKMLQIGVVSKFTMVITYLFSLFQPTRK
jgi:glycosyltransferase involved in cell wall biosynthesis